MNITYVYTYIYIYIYTYTHMYACTCYMYDVLCIMCIIRIPQLTFIHIHQSII